MRIDHKGVTAGATARASELTNSVLVLARLSKITAPVLAKGLADSEANATYFSEVVAEMVKTDLAEAIAEAKKDN